jgi:hypothetical protein
MIAVRQHGHAINQEHTDQGQGCNEAVHLEVYPFGSVGKIFKGPLLSCASS